MCDKAQSCSDASNLDYQLERGRTLAAERPIMTYTDWLEDVDELVTEV